jgi:hypothetical protein
MYRYADEPEQIRKITQSTFLTLFTAETQPGVMKDVVEDMIVDSSMMELDNELRDLLENGA